MKGGWQPLNPLNREGGAPPFGAILAALVAGIYHRHEVCIEALRNRLECGVAEVCDGTQVYSDL